MSEQPSKPALYPVFDHLTQSTQVDQKAFRMLTRQAAENEDLFWDRIGKRLDWIEPYTKIKDVSFDLDDLHIRWFEDGVLNVSANCIDRHLASRGDQVAIL